VDLRYRRVPEPDEQVGDEAGSFPEKLEAHPLWEALLVVESEGVVDGVPGEEGSDLLRRYARRGLDSEEGRGGRALRQGILESRRSPPRRLPLTGEAS
jgi:hypothetical protein